MQDMQYEYYYLVMSNGSGWVFYTSDEYDVYGSTDTYWIVPGTYNFGEE